MKYKNFFFLFFFLLTSCGSFSEKPYRIGIDPYWYPINFSSKEGDVNAFINELLQMIAYSEGVVFERVQANWDSIYSELERGQYQGIISSLSPNTFKRELFSFSDPILMTGPVLVMRQDESQTSLADFSGRTILILDGSSDIQILQQYPEIIVRTTTSIPMALNQVSEEAANGALVASVFAKSFVNDQYADTLKIQGEPLTNNGLRLITMRDEAQDRKLLKIFSNGLKKLQGKKLDALKEKWGL